MGSVFNLLAFAFLLRFVSCLAALISLPRSWIQCKLITQALIWLLFFCMFGLFVVLLNRTFFSGSEIRATWFRHCMELELSRHNYPSSWFRWIMRKSELTFRDYFNLVLALIACATLRLNQFLLRSIIWREGFNHIIKSFTAKTKK